MNEEIWKDIPGYDGVYQFSNMDRARTTDHFDAANRFAAGKILKPHLNRKCVAYGLCKDKKMKYFDVRYLRKLVFGIEDLRDDGERWLPVVGFEDYYEVNEDGVIRSKEYAETVKNKSIHRYPKILKQHENSDGYYMVKLRDNRQHSVHQIVAEAFLGEHPDDYEVDHIDADRKNNNYKNLRYVTHQKNIQHSIELGHRLVGNFKEKNYNSKKVSLTDQDNNVIEFNCIMDACEYIKDQCNISTTVASMYISLKKSFLNNTPYYGYIATYL